MSLLLPVLESGVGVLRGREWKSQSDDRPRDRRRDEQATNLKTRASERAELDRIGGGVGPVAGKNLEWQRREGGGDESFESDLGATGRRRDGNARAEEGPSAAITHPRSAITQAETRVLPARGPSSGSDGGAAASSWEEGFLRRDSVRIRVGKVAKEVCETRYPEGAGRSDGRKGEKKVSRVLSPPENRRVSHCSVASATSKEKEREPACVSGDSTIRLREFEERA